MIVTKDSYKLSSIFTAITALIFIWLAIESIILFVFPEKAVSISHPDYKDLITTTGRIAPGLDRSPQFRLIVNYNDIMPFQCRVSFCSCDRTDLNLSEAQLKNRHITVKWHLDSENELLTWLEPDKYRYAYEIKDNYGICYSYSEATSYKGVTQDEANRVNESTKKSIFRLLLCFLVFLFLSISIHKDEKNT